MKIVASLKKALDSLQIMQSVTALMRYLIKLIINIKAHWMHARKQSQSFIKKLLSV